MPRRRCLARGINERRGKNSGSPYLRPLYPSLHPFVFTPRVTMLYARPRLLILSRQYSALGAAVSRMSLSFSQARGGPRFVSLDFSLFMYIYIARSSRVSPYLHRYLGSPPSNPSVFVLESLSQLRGLLLRFARLPPLCYIASVVNRPDYR